MTVRTSNEGRQRDQGGSRPCEQRGVGNSEFGVRDAAPGGGPARHHPSLAPISGQAQLSPIIGAPGADGRERRVLPAEAKGDASMPSRIVVVHDDADFVARSSVALTRSGYGSSPSRTQRRHFLR
jgi:hypothetical protein